MRKITIKMILKQTPFTNDVDGRNGMRGYVKDNRHGDKRSTDHTLFSGSLSLSLSLKILSNSKCDFLNTFKFRPKFS